MDKTCSICNQTKPTNEYFKNIRAKDGLQKHCKLCHTVMAKRWMEKNSEYYKARKREYKKKYFAENREKVRVSQRTTYRKYREAYRKRARDKDRRWYDEAIAAYGGKCNCCGEDKRYFLCLDHINNDGAEHRKGLGSTIALWAKRNNYPSSLQILCYNCNNAKARNEGVCPCKSE